MLELSTEDVIPPTTSAENYEVQANIVGIPAPLEYNTCVKARVSTSVDNNRAGIDLVDRKGENYAYAFGNAEDSGQKVKSAEKNTKKEKNKSAKDVILDNNDQRKEMCKAFIDLRECTNAK